MFERFTDRARHVVVLAQEEARRLQHSYIGTEHVLLGLLGEPGELAFRALEQFGLSLEGAREEVKTIVGIGKSKETGHIPFTPRAKKTLELALREALQLHHHYIGTEHILLGVIREGQGVGAQILKQHADDPMAIRAAVLELLSTTPTEDVRRTRWLRRPPPGPGYHDAGEAGRSTELRTTPAADSSLSKAARLAGSQPVGSHHLLLAALGDPDSAAARALAALGIDLDQARQALRTADVTGTADEPPEEAGRRQMLIRVTDQQVTIEAADPVIVGIARAAVDALGDRADPPGTIRGDLPLSASLSDVWHALHNSLASIHRRATFSPKSPGSPGEPEQPGTEVA